MADPKYNQTETLPAMFGLFGKEPGMRPASSFCEIHQAELHTAGVHDHARKDKKWQPLTE